MRIADFMVATRSWDRPPRRGDDGRCFVGEAGSPVVVPGAVLLAALVPVALVWDAFEIRELADAECVCFADSRFVVLLLLLGYGWR